jgi:simple sugar transport system ATP-binding protein
MVHQHFTSVPALTVGENIALSTGRSVGPSDRRSSAFLAGLDLAVRVEDLSVGLKQRLEVAKALATGARILLLDEPSAVLVPSEIEELLRAMREFAAAGGAVVLITHKLDEVFAAADEVTVLRRGRAVLTGPMTSQTREGLAQSMIGGSLAVLGMTPAPALGMTPVVQLRDATIPLWHVRSPGVRHATLTVNAGEILGVAAVEGNGQRELMLGVAGILMASGGTVDVASPVALVPEDRTTEGLIPAMTLAENVVLGRGPDTAWTRGVWLDWNAANRATAELLARFDVRAAGPRSSASMLSGGNQQKLILGRGLSTRPRVLVVENPTRGLDLRATSAMHHEIRAAAAEGVAVLMYSSDLDEVLLLAHRVVVICRGALTELEPPFQRGLVGQAMLGVADV